ncbi:hypothetical protein Rhal01_03405 [Rubritalea halochordaticola]|uniref:Uncharacterized protein n=1 Tax=Rubritalea halochordaticola TaxID=714537 RepID=A0ABP9V9C3_9BACT
MFYIVLGAWLAGVVVSWINHNRKLPISIFALGSLVLALQFTVGLGILSVAVLAILAAIIWIANKLDMA